MGTYGLCLSKTAGSGKIAGSDVHRGGKMRKALLGLLVALVIGSCAQPEGVSTGQGQPANAFLGTWYMAEGFLYEEDYDTYPEVLAEDRYIYNSLEFTSTAVILSWPEYASFPAGWEAYPVTYLTSNKATLTGWGSWDSEPTTIDLAGDIVTLVTARATIYVNGTPSQIHVLITTERWSRTKAGAVRLAYEGKDWEDTYRNPILPEDTPDHFDGIGTAGNVKFVKGTDGVTKHNVWVITWDVADDASGYEIVWQSTGKKTIETRATGGIVYGEDADSNDDDFAPTNTKYYIAKNSSPWWQVDSTATADPDKWSAVVTLNSTNLKGATKGKLGVIAIPLFYNDKNYNIVWSDEITIE